MISGADDRLAFVITTEAQLDGIVAARAEVRGLGVDSEQSAVKMAAASRANAQATADQMSPMSKILAAKSQLVAEEEKGAKATAAASATTVAATKNMGMWSALQAEATGHVGKHTLAIGQMERRLASETEHMLGVNRAAGLMGTSLLKFGIGTIETVGILAGIAAIGYAYHKMTDEANEGAKKLEDAQLQNLKNLTIGNVAANIAGIRTARDQAVADAAKAADVGYFQRLKNMMGADLTTPQGRAMATGGGADFTNVDRLNKLLEAGSKIALDKLHAERMRLLAQHDQMEFQIKTNALELIGARVTEGSLDQNARRREQLITQAAIEDARIKQSFVYRDSQGNILELTGAQTREMSKLIAQHRELTDIQLHELAQSEQLANAAYKRSVATAVAGVGGTFSDSTVAGRYQAKVDEINAEADLDLKAGRDAVEVERKKQAQIRQLRRETAKQAADDSKTITAVLLASGSRDVRAVGHAADSIRRVLIGAQAAHAAVESAIEGGKALGAAATGNFAGAALHTASSIQLAAAALLGAKESLGGGGYSGTGGGAGSGGGSTTFEPRSGTEGTNSVTIQLYTMNPFGAESMQQVSYLLQRADILKRPIQISVPPTTGVIVGGR